MVSKSDRFNVQLWIVVWKSDNQPTNCEINPFPSIILINLFRAKFKTLLRRSNYFTFGISGIQCTCKIQQHVAQVPVDIRKREQAKTRLRKNEKHSEQALTE